MRGRRQLQGPTLVRYVPEDGAWEVIQTAGNAAAREAFSMEEFKDSRNSLKKFLCNYFSTGECNAAQGNAIRPMGATPTGGKILKVRWALPGSGKSGSLRLSVVVYCEKRRVVIAEAFLRRDDPSAEEFSASIARLE